MSTNALRTALTDIVTDVTLRKDFLAVWPVVEAILEAFARATELPIFAYLDEHHVFQSSLATMPAFCTLMLRDPELASRCARDGGRRATVVGPDIGDAHMCHAGLMNSRRQVDTGCGPILSILFGSQLISHPESERRRGALLEEVAKTNPVLANSLRQSSIVPLSASRTAQPGAWRDSKHASLMDAIANIVERLLSETVGVHSLSINLAHEVSLVLTGMAACAEEMEDNLSVLGASPEMEHALKEMSSLQRQYSTQAQLGLYVVQNFLSYASEHRYGEVTHPYFVPLDLAALVLDVIEIHRPFAAKKGITFEVAGLDELPRIRGVEMELRRLLFNVLNNAVKYSYHSTESTHRSIRVDSKVPYDPGFSQKRFALNIGNYGLGLTNDEKAQIYRAGVRGRQARVMVPAGAGIGLSEAVKIMKLHKGSVRINSTKLHDTPSGEPTYLTSVDLIFPYIEDHTSRHA